MSQVCEDIYLLEDDPLVIRTVTGKLISIEVDANATVKISGIGFETQNLTIAGTLFELTVKGNDK